MLAVLTWFLRFLNIQHNWALLCMCMLSLAVQASHTRIIVCMAILALFGRGVHLLINAVQARDYMVDLQVSLLDPVTYPGAIKAFAKEVCRNDLLNFGRLHFFFPDSRLALDLNTDKTLKVSRTSSLTVKHAFVFASTDVTCGECRQGHCLHPM